MINPDIKGWIDSIASVGTVLGFMGAGVLWYISRRDTKRAAETAISQINELSTNHFPHLEQNLSELNKKTDTGNEILRALQLGQVETNTILRGK